MLRFPVDRAIGAQSVLVAYFRESASKAALTRQGVQDAGVRGILGSAFARMLGPLRAVQDPACWEVLEHALWQPCGLIEWSLACMDLGASASGTPRMACLLSSSGTLTIRLSA